MTRILILTAFVFFFASNAHAQNDMKRADTNFIGNIEKQDSSFPLQYRGWTNDFERILTREQVFILDSIIGHFEKQTTVEMVIVTIDSSFVQAGNFDNLITSLGRIWGVGKKNTNNGIMIGISSGLRKIRISTGYGIETKLSDSDAKMIIDKIMVPKFKNAAFYEGLKEGLYAIMAFVK